MIGGDDMKKLLINLLWGFPILIAVQLCEFAVTLPFGDPGGNLSKYLTYEFLLAAIPAGVVTFAFAAITKTKAKADALMKSITWTAFVTLCYLVIGIGNGTFQPIFGNFAFYIFIFCIFAGPMVYVKYKKLN
jgi:hypothetical protein